MLGISENNINKMIKSKNNQKTVCIPWGFEKLYCHEYNNNIFVSNVKAVLVFIFYLLNKYRLAGNV